MCDKIKAPYKFDKVTSVYYALFNLKHKLKRSAVTIKSNVFMLNETST
jgi:hypothetical protein